MPETRAGQTSVRSGSVCPSVLFHIVVGNSYAVWERLINYRRLVGLYATIERELGLR